MAEEKVAQFVKAISVTSLAILLGREGYQAPVRHYPILSTKAACSKILCKYAMSIIQSNAIRGQQLDGSEN